MVRSGTQKYLRTAVYSNFNQTQAVFAPFGCKMGARKSCTRTIQNSGCKPTFLLQLGGFAWVLPALA
jgi:hypothetical protein